MAIITLMEQIYKFDDLEKFLVDGIKEEDIKSLLKMADLPESGQIKLFDGRTGDAFDRDQ